MLHFWVRMQVSINTISSLENLIQEEMITSCFFASDLGRLFICLFSTATYQPKEKPPPTTKIFILPSVNL